MSTRGLGFYITGDERRGRCNERRLLLHLTPTKLVSLFIGSHVIDHFDHRAFYRFSHSLDEVSLNNL